MKLRPNVVRQTVLVALCALATSPAAMFATDASKSVTEKGVIKTVDKNNQQIVVTDQKTKADGTFQWNDQTKFIEQGKSVTTSALKAGMPIKISYTSSSGTPVLARVKLSPTKAQKHSSLFDSSHQKS